MSESPLSQPTHLISRLQAPPMQLLSMGSPSLRSHYMWSCTLTLTLQMGKVKESWLLPLNTTKARAHKTQNPSKAHIPKHKESQKGSLKTGNLSKPTKPIASLKASDKAQIHQILQPSSLVPEHQQVPSTLHPSLLRIKPSMPWAIWMNNNAMELRNSMINNIR